VFVGASITNLDEMQLRHEIGIGSMMFGIDYPHPEGSWGRATSWLQASLGKAGVTEQEARMILGENAARLYDVDIAELQPVADVVGPTIDEVLSAATDAEISELLSEASDSGRKLAALQYEKR
jgi:hypothetical protein